MLGPQASSKKVEKHQLTKKEKKKLDKEEKKRKKERGKAGGQSLFYFPGKMFIFLVKEQPS